MADNYRKLEEDKDKEGKDYTTPGTPLSYYDQQVKALGAQRDSSAKTTNEQYDAAKQMLIDMYGRNTERLAGQYAADRGVLSGQYGRNVAALRQGADQQRQEASIIYDKMRKYLPQQAQQAGVAGTGYYGPESLRLRANSNLQKSLGEIETQYGKNKATLDTANESALNELMRQYGSDRTSLDNDYAKSMTQNEIARSEALQKIVDSYNTGVSGYRADEYKESQMKAENDSAAKAKAKSDAVELVTKYGYGPEELAAAGLGDALTGAELAKLQEYYTKQNTTGSNTGAKETGSNYDSILNQALKLLANETIGFDSEQAVVDFISSQFETDNLSYDEAVRMLGVLGIDIDEMFAE